MLVCMLSRSGLLFVTPWTVCSSLRGIFQARILEERCHFLLQGIFPPQAWNLHLLQLLRCQMGSLPLNHLEIQVSHDMRITGISQ